MSHCLPQMAAGNLQGNMPVLISVQQPGSANSWPEPEEPSASTAAEENIPFTRCILALCIKHIHEKSCKYSPCFSV